MMPLIARGEKTAPWTSDNLMVTSDSVDSGPWDANHEWHLVSPGKFHGTTSAAGFIGLGKLIISHVMANTSN